MNDHIYTMWILSWVEVAYLLFSQPCGSPLWLCNIFMVLTLAWRYKYITMYLMWMCLFLLSRFASLSHFLICHSFSLKTTEFNFDYNYHNTALKEKYVCFNSFPLKMILGDDLSFVTLQWSCHWLRYGSYLSAHYFMTLGDLENACASS